jgi:steroid 5-alpha reductase family enzyme
MMFSFLLLLGLSMVMACGWAFQRQVEDGSWTDVYWTFGVGAACIVCALSPGSHVTLRQALAAAIAGVWSLRLGLHIARRIADSCEEDRRYAELRLAWGDDFQYRMLWLMQAQAPAGAVLAGAVYAAAHNPAPFGRPQDLAAMAFVAVGLAGESLADAQLRRFKADPANKDKVADAGLWAWSRHPNYFFDWLVWLAYVPLALGPNYPQGWWALAAPILMFVLLNYVSGVPPVERAMRRSRGAAFAAYQARTSRFLPLPPRDA